MATFLKLAFNLLPILIQYVATFEGNDNIGQLNDFFQFRTRPDILAPRWNITTYDPKALAPGYWFVGPYIDIGSRARGEAWLGPHIYDQTGELVWSGAPQFDHFMAHDLRIAQVGGIDMLTVVYSHNNSGVILDKNYHIVRDVVYGDSHMHSNFHDFNVVEDGTRALVLTRDEHKKLSKEQTKAIGLDAECVVRGDGMKYLDITTSPPQKLFVWNASDYLPLDETFFRPQGELLDEYCSGKKMWDIHHANSVDLFPDGDFLFSLRQSWTLYKISHHNGSIIWRIGGNHSDFALPKEAQFHFQHHGRVHVQNETHIVISLLDNSKRGPRDDHPARKHSAGLILALDTTAMTGQLVAEYPYPHEAHSWKRGSAHLLPNGNAFMCWADDMHISEHAADGRLLMEAHVLPHLDTYRSYKYEWIGEPVTPPDVYSSAFLAGSNVSTIVYVSWNGATEVTQWKLYDGTGASKRLLVTTERKGFETMMTYDGFVPYVYVEAANKNEDTIGTSNTVRTNPPVEQDATSRWPDLRVFHSTTPTNTFLFMLGCASCVIVFLAARQFLAFKRRYRHQRRRDGGYEAVPQVSYEGHDGDMQVLQNR